MEPISTVPPLATVARQTFYHSDHLHMLLKSGKSWYKYSNDGCEHIQTYNKMIANVLALAMVARQPVNHRNQLQFVLKSRKS